MGARLHGMQKVEGSNPFASTRWVPMVPKEPSGLFRGKPLEEALGFAKTAAFFSHVELTNLLLLHIGEQDREAQLLEMCQNA